MTRITAGSIVTAIATIASLLEILRSVDEGLPIIPSVSVLIQVLSQFSIIGVFAFPLWLAYHFIVGEKIKFIYGLSAHVFFPEGVFDKDRTLDYHKKYLHHRLIINHKTTPPTAYYLPTGSYGWKLINKYRELWVSENDPSPRDDGFTKRWCEEKYDWTKPVRCFVCDGIIAPTMPQVTVVDSNYHEWCKKWFDEQAEKLNDNPQYKETLVLLATPRDWVRLERKEKRIAKIFAGSNP